MPTRRKQPPATNLEAETHSPSTVPSQGQWKTKAVAFLFALILLSAIWSTGVFNSLFAGPKIPLPRQVGGLSLGMDMDAVLQKYPGIKKKLRPFNNDPQFQIVTLGPTEGITEASTMDLLFFVPDKKLYFLSAMWDSNLAQSVPVEVWAKQYRRWNKSSNNTPESLGNDVTLKEWNFNDSQTEMTLRDLNYSDHIQRWQDLRDATNAQAQSAFAKYRLDVGT